jgi:serine/threonine-protein kinase
MHLESDPAFYSRFEREEEIGKSLNHPGILKIIPTSTKKSRPYFAMELLDGKTLDELVRDKGKLPIPQALAFASRICEALDYMHSREIVHRDLKPANIMVCDDGSIRIMDFGIAKAQAMRRITFGGFSPTMGTPDYMAPEQVKGKRGDHRTDIYSLGAILYEMTTGSTLFQGESPYVVMNARVTGDPEAPRKLNSNLTPVVEEIILHALERDPEQRFESASAMKRELDNYELVSLTDRFQRLRAPQPWKSGRPMWLMIGGIVGFQVLLGFLMFLYFKSKH